MLLCENKQSYARKQKIYKGSQSPKNQEKLRNARLCNYDKVLFICHGNICRSPMCQSIFTHMVKEQNLTNHFKIDSAATSREEIGNPPHYGTAGKLRQVGIPLIPHRAEQMTKADYDAYDYLIGMDSMNIRNIMRIIGKRYTKKKVYRLLDFSDSPRDIADPWYTGNFDRTYEDSVEGCRALLEKNQTRI